MAVALATIGGPIWAAAASTRRAPGWTFQIGMLPRAGSAWMATLLNMHEGVFCYHDALGAYKGKYNDAPYAKAGYRHVGDASSYCMMLPHLSRSVYVERPTQECYLSLKEIGLDSNYTEVESIAEEWKKGCENFQFNDIFGKDEGKALFTLDSIFRIVVPGVALNHDKVRMLRPLKVELLENGPQIFDIEDIKWRMN